MHPLVFASQAALEEAHRVLPRGAVIEREVERTLRAGRATRSAPDGWELRPGQLVAHGFGWHALIERTRSPLTKRRSWIVVRVER